MEDRDDFELFITLVAHELKNIFALINAASACALERPDPRYIHDIRNASEAGYRVLQNIQLLARPVSTSYPLRTHRLRAIADMIKRRSAKRHVTISIQEDRMIDADLSLLDAAIHQMFAIAGDTVPHLTVRLIGDAKLQMQIEWSPRETVHFAERDDPHFGQQLLQKIAELHGGHFESKYGSRSTLSLTLPLK